MDAEAGTRHSETLRTDIRPKNPTPLGVGDVNKNSDSSFNSENSRV